MISEEEQSSVLAACSAGDRRAQEKLYRSFYGAMMNLCLRYTKNEMDAMEALNTGFYRVLKNIRRYDPGKASLYTWIRTIVINSCIDHLKMQVKNETLPDLAAETNEAEPDIFSKLSSVALLDLVRKLPAATKAVFNLFVMEGYSHREIAELLRISEGTSKWHLSDARKKLQQMIQEDK